MKLKVFANKHEVNYDLMRQDRMNSGVEQGDLAFQMGLHPSAVCGWECGKRTPKIKHLLAFSSLLDTSPERYLSGTSLKQMKAYQALMRVGVEI